MKVHNRMNRYVVACLHPHLHHRHHHHHHRPLVRLPLAKKHTHTEGCANDSGSMKEIQDLQLVEQFVEILDASDVINHLYHYRVHWQNEVHVHDHVHFASLTNRQTNTEFHCSSSFTYYFQSLIIQRILIERRPNFHIMFQTTRCNYWKMWMWFKNIHSPINITLVIPDTFFRILIPDEHMSTIASTDNILRISSIEIYTFY